MHTSRQPIFPDANGLPLQLIPPHPSLQLHSSLSGRGYRLSPSLSAPQTTSQRCPPLKKSRKLTRGQAVLPTKAWGTLALSVKLIAFSKLPAAEGRKLAVEAWRAVFGYIGLARDLAMSVGHKEDAYVRAAAANGDLPNAKHIVIYSDETHC